MGNTNNKNARKNIQAALLELMNRKQFDRISITEIIQLAQVSRTTYYYHYYTQRDILNEIIDDIINQVANACKDFNTFSQNDLEQLSNCILNCFYENRSSIKTILSGDMADIFRQKYHDFLESSIADLIVGSSIKSEIHNTSFEYFFAGHYHLIKDWILDDCKISCEEYSQTLGKISTLFSLPSLNT